MTPERWNHVKLIFGTALDLGEAERKTGCAKRARRRKSLCREVESLLAAAEGPPSFIDTPVMEHALRLPADSDPATALTWPGRTIGHYRIIEEIGRGGMSAVFRAARIEDHFEHEVAIKLLTHTHDTQLLLRRFRAERQILARLSHPSIAHLLDGGSTEEGLPYLVMEYVRGEPIDAYCERRNLDIPARLRFRTLCDTVHYVHRHLMVHGDLKCNNVLVNEDGIVKLLDFGVARLLETNPATQSAHHKLAALVALTPEYASPEQVGASRLPPPAMSIRWVSCCTGFSRSSCPTVRGRARTSTWPRRSVTPSRGVPARGRRSRHRRAFVATSTTSC